MKENDVPVTISIPILICAKVVQVHLSDLDPNDLWVCRWKPSALHPPTP